MRDDNPFEDGPRGSIDRGFLIAAVIVFAAVAAVTAWLYLAPGLSVRLVPASSPVKIDLLPPPAPQRERPEPHPGRDNPSPAWRNQPVSSFPERAIEAEVREGQVKLVCGTLPTGAVTDCTVIEETPPGYGFADEALRAAHDARVWPRRKDGVARPGTVRFTVRYRQGF